MKKIYPQNLNDFLRCRHITTLMRQKITADEVQDDEVAFLRQRGLEHEKSYLDSLEGDVFIVDTEASKSEQAQQTIAAMEAGAAIIYQAFLQDESRAGHADFLIKQNKPSHLGDFSYSIADTKLALRGKPENIIQLVHYSELLTQYQGFRPSHAKLVYGNLKEENFAIDEFIHYYREILQQYLAFIEKPQTTEAFPISYCRGCRYSGYCHRNWHEEKSVGLIAGLKRADAQYLKDQGFNNYPQLAESNEINTGEKAFLWQQQAKALLLNKVIAKNPSAAKVFANQANKIHLHIYKHILPFNDVQMFALGIYLPKTERFEFLLALTPAEERRAFERLMTFLMRSFNKQPDSQLVVFSQVESRILHDLSSRLNTCQEQVDWLIHNEKILPLKQSIRQAYYLPIEDYSLEKIMRFCNSEEAEKLTDYSVPEAIFENMIANNERCSELEDKMLLEVKSQALIAEFMQNISIQ